MRRKTTGMSYLVLVPAAVLLVLLSACENGQPGVDAGGAVPGAFTAEPVDSEALSTDTLDYERWIVSEPVFTPGPAGTFDDVAVKDPTIVYYDGAYHLFYTSKAAKATQESLEYVGSGGSGLGYASAPTLEELDAAERFNLNAIVDEVVIAAQVFYFEPHELWYLVAQTAIDTESRLAPIYLTNPDISDVEGWSDPVVIQPQRPNGKFWIDFWVICDDETAHFFYTDHAGGLFRMETPIGEFPDGLSDAEEIEVLTTSGETEIGTWRLHEASHIYYVESTGEYLNVMEAVYPHPTRAPYWDSRNRFMFAMVADDLRGPWRRVESDHNEFAGDPARLFREDGERSDYDQVSHFEVIRSGYDQRLTIDDYRLEILFQAFDADETPDDYDYNLLPWELAVMRNYE